MKGLFVILLCATAGYCVKGSPLPAYAATAQSPVVGSRLNPFLRSSQLKKPSGGLIKQKSGGNPFLQGSHLQKPSGGLVNQQSGGKPVVGSHLQGLGGLINQQSGVNPFLHGSEQKQTPSGGVLNQQSGVNPFLHGSQQQQTPSGGVLNQQLGVKPVGPTIPTPSELINQQTEVQPEDSHPHSPVSVGSKSSEVNPEDSHHQEPIGIINQDSEVNPDGSYHNVWESENGIKVQEEGMLKVKGEDEILSVSGSISYTDADGTPIHLTYIADENGFQPQGDHLPTSPPIPQSVARALEYIAAHPYVEEEHTKESTLVKEEMPIVEVA